MVDNLTHAIVAGHKICAGCDRKELIYLVPCCTVYHEVPHLFLTHNECPFNPVKREAVRGKVRVGQQRQRKAAWRT